MLEYLTFYFLFYFIFACFNNSIRNITDAVNGEITEVLLEAGPLYAPSLIFSLIILFIRWLPKPVPVRRQCTLTNSLGNIQQHQPIDALVHLGLQKVFCAILLLVDHLGKVVILAVVLVKHCSPWSRCCLDTPFLEKQRDCTFPGVYHSTVPAKTHETPLMGGSQSH